MGSVMKFVDVKNTGMRKGNGPCKMPIEVFRVSFRTILVRFRLDLFEEKRVDFALEYVFRCQTTWRMIKVGKASPHFDEKFVSYLVSVVDQDVIETRAALGQIFDLMSQAVYREVARMRWLSERPIEDMTKPKRTIAEALYIEARTVNALRKADVYSMYDLASLRREDVAKIPGMTMNDIFRIERTLASLGWSLESTEIPAWS